VWVAQGQVEYVQSLAAYGKPVILVIVSGRPKLLHDAVSSSDAVINAYVPGPRGGLALAETLTGANVPAGRLPYRLFYLFFIYAKIQHVFFPELFRGFLTHCNRLTFSLSFFPSFFFLMFFFSFLRVSYPRHAGDIPYAYHHKPGDQCVDPDTGAYIICQVTLPCV
jgi:hypothetical protein